MDNRSIQDIDTQIRAHPPNLIETGDNKLASVALIFRNIDNSPEILFIERAENKNDPWSGQIAFPGGNKNHRDENGDVTARRETCEEVGLSLPLNSLVGRLDDQQGRNNQREIPLIISCYVYHLELPQETRNSQEVGDSFWVSIDKIRHLNNQLQYQTIYSAEPYPATLLPSGKVLWGLTYRFVQMFLRVTE